MGHTVALLGLGGLLVVMQRQVRPTAAALLEGLVGVMLMALGLAALRRALRQGTKGPVRQHVHGDELHALKTSSAHLHIGPWALADSRWWWVSRMVWRAAGP